MRAVLPRAQAERCRPCVAAILFKNKEGAAAARGNGERGVERRHR